MMCIHQVPSKKLQLDDYHQWIDILCMGLTFFRHIAVPVLIFSLLISLLSVTQTYGQLDIVDIELRIKESKTKEEWVKWASKAYEWEFRRIGYSEEDVQVEIKIKGALITATYRGSLIKDKGFRSLMMKRQSSDLESVSDAKLYSLGIRFMSVYLEDGTILMTSKVTN
jgi:hypothetical protein